MLQHSLLQQTASVQIKRWAASTPGWSITSLFMTASKFDSAPTGSSTIMRFLKPKGSPERAGHGPALPSAERSGMAGAACRGPGLAAPLPAEAAALNSRAADMPVSAGTAHSLSGYKGPESAEPGEAAAQALMSGLPSFAQSADASIGQDSWSMPPETSVSRVAGDADGRFLQASHHTSIPHRNESEQDPPGVATRADPALELPGSLQQSQGTLLQDLEQSRPSEVLCGSCSADAMLHGTSCTPPQEEVAAPVYAGQADAALQHEQPSHDSQPRHSDAATAKAPHGAGRELQSSMQPDSRTAVRGDCEDSRSCQKADGCDEADTVMPGGSRQQSMREGKHEGSSSGLHHLSHQVWALRGDVAVNTEVVCRLDPVFASMQMVCLLHVCLEATAGGNAELMRHLMQGLKMHAARQWL